MRLPDLRKLPAFAKAQAWGLAVGFALAWLATDRWGLSFWGMIGGAIAAWLAWELLLGKRAPSARADIPALAYGIATGFTFPWIGVALTALLQYARP